jgi:NDP-sugar pyrophosphorylase family protein
VVIATIGGRGTRLYPLTLLQPKPLVPLVNYPIFTRMLEVLARQGIKRFVFASRGIRNTLHLKDVFRYGGAFSRKLSLPDAVKFMYQPNYRDKGSADAVRCSMDYYDINDEVMVVSGDNIADIKVNEILSQHRATDAVATVVLKEMPPNVDISEYGVADLDSAGRIIRFVEKPKEGEAPSRYINAGIYFFSPKISDILTEMGNEARDIGANLMPYLVENGYPVFSYNCPGYWADVGVPDNFLKTSLDILNQKVENIRFRKEHKQSEGVWIHSTTMAMLQGAIPNVKKYTFIGGDCDIHPKMTIENSSIGDNCVIEEGVKIQNSVVMDFVNIEKNVKLNSCIIGRYVRLGQGSIIDAGDSVEVTGKKERTPVVGDGVHIVKNSILGGYKRVAPITHAHNILKTGRFVDIGYDSNNVYFIEK